MSHLDQMIDYLCKQYRSDPWVHSVLGSIGGQLDKIGFDTKNLSEQLFIDTATWALAIYERALGITPASTAAIEDRRAAVEAKWKSDSKMDIAILQTIADSWKNGAVQVGFSSGTIIMTFVGEYGVPSDMDNLRSVMEDARPAHLPIQYILKYLLVRDLHGQKTIAEMDSLTLNKFAGGAA